MNFTPGQTATEFIAGNGLFSDLPVTRQRLFADKPGDSLRFTKQRARRDDGLMSDGENRK